MDPRPTAANRLPTDFLPGEPSRPEVRAAQREALDAQPLLADMLENLPVPAAVLNEARETLSANQRLWSLVGLEPAVEDEPRRMGALLGCANEADAPSGCGTHDRCKACGIVRSVLTVLRTGHSADGFASVLTSSGQALELELRSSLLQVETPAPLLLVVMRDVAHERRREWLERVFLHDVQNTAGGLRGLLELAEESPGEMQPLLLAQADALLDEIRAQRDILRMEAGDWEPRPGAVRLDALLARIVNACQKAPGLPRRRIWVQGDPKLHLRLDGALLGRVVMNMLRNALEATPAGKVVRLGVEAAGDGVRVAVNNPGTIPIALQRTIFHKVRSTKGTGRGFGTYSMRLIGERYLGAEVAFTSSPQAGTTFEVRLPASCVLHDAPSTNGAGVVTSERLEGMQVLLVEDMEINRMVARRQLERLGARVVEACDAGEAHARLERGPFDAALVDLDLPDARGDDVIRSIRAAEAAASARAFVAAVTGHEDADTRRRVQQAGADCLLAKPLRSGVLAQALRSRTAA